MFFCGQHYKVKLLGALGILQLDKDDESPTQGAALHSSS